MWSWLAVCQAARPDASTQWYWLSSDNRYTKYFAPALVQIISAADIHGQSVPTLLSGWVKTNFSYEGAADTIDGYGLKSLLPDPKKLSYSLERVEINPQNRTIRNMEEEFYDAQGHLLWSTNDPGSAKEINSQSFDEPFYFAIVDQAIGAGIEAERGGAKDRWLPLYKGTSASGMTEEAQADTSTMRMKGINLIYWEWRTTKDANGNITAIHFQKKAVNLPMGTERIIVSKIWTPQNAWQDEAADSAYTAIAPNSNEAQALAKLRQYADAHADWVHRYNIELNPSTTNVAASSTMTDTKGRGIRFEDQGQSA